MEYQVQLDPNKLASYGVNVSQIVSQLAANNANAGGGFYSQGGQFFYVRGLGQVRTSRTSATSSSPRTAAFRCT